MNFILLNVLAWQNLSDSRGKMINVQAFSGLEERVNYSPKEQVGRAGSVLSEVAVTTLPPSVIK